MINSQNPSLLHANRTSLEHLPLSSHPPGNMLLTSTYKVKETRCTCSGLTPLPHIPASINMEDPTVAKQVSVYMGIAVMASETEANQTNDHIWRGRCNRHVNWGQLIPIWDKLLPQSAIIIRQAGNNQIAVLGNQPCRVSGNGGDMPGCRIYLCLIAAPALGNKPSKVIKAFCQHVGQRPDCRGFVKIMVKEYLSPQIYVYCCYDISLKI